jgi:hypothetical protein
MSDVDKDAAEPLMEQSKEALGDVPGEEDVAKLANPPPGRGDWIGSHTDKDTAPRETATEA